MTQNSLVLLDPLDCVELLDPFEPPASPQSSLIVFLYSKLGLPRHKVHLDNERSERKKVVDPGHIENTQGLINESEELEDPVVVLCVDLILTNCITFEHVSAIERYLKLLLAHLLNRMLVQTPRVHIIKSDDLGQRCELHDDSHELVQGRQVVNDERLHDN